MSGGMATILVPVVAALDGATDYASARRAILKSAHRPTPPGLVTSLDALLRFSHREGVQSANGDG